MSVIVITATYLDMTFATTANITSVVETGGYFVRTVICTIIWASFPMSHVDDMRGDRMRLIDADALMADCQLAQKQADKHRREFANAFYSGSGEISTEWWCVEDMIENAPTIESKHKTGKWIRIGNDTFSCNKCGHLFIVIQGSSHMNFCPNCNADMRGEQNE